MTLHMLAAFIWLGGMLFLGVVGAPVLRSVEPPALRQRLFQQLGLRFRVVGWAAIAVLVKADSVPTMNAAVEQNQPPPAASQSACVRGVVAWYGVCDFTSYEGRKAAAFLGCRTPATCSAEVERAASPVTYIDAQDPPFLVIHGTTYVVVPHQQAQRLYDALRAANVRAELVTLPGVGHSFLGQTPRRRARRACRRGSAPSRSSNE